MQSAETPEAQVGSPVRLLLRVLSCWCRLTSAYFVTLAEASDANVNDHGCDDPKSNEESSKDDGVQLGSFTDEAPVTCR